MGPLLPGTVIPALPEPALAVNYSHEAAALFERGELEIDCWKCSPPGTVAGTDLAIDSGIPAYVHFPFDLGKPSFADTDWDEVAQILDDTGTRFVNVHLNAKKSDFLDLSKAGEREAVRERFLRGLSIVVDRFGADRVIAENVIYRGEEGAYIRASVEPDLITEVIAESGCLLLLDTAHATISVRYLGSESVQAYIEALPVDRIAEVHLTGAVHDGNRYRDSMPMTELDWTTAARAIEKIRHGDWRMPWAVALEYGGIGASYEWRSESAVIRDEVARLAELLRG